MKTLYVSDLDKTLLRSNQKTSEFTNNTINRLIEKGMLFSFATARSYYTVKKVTKGLNIKLPLIIYNGAFIIDSQTGELLISNYLDTADKIVDDLLHHNIYPIVYSYINSAERFSYVKDKCTKGMTAFLGDRTDDIRNNPLDDEKQLCGGIPFYITCMDEEEKLAPLYEKYRKDYHCVFHRDVYSGEQWLEIMSKEASKANALKQLKEYLKCDRVVVFGDHKNDIDMFETADECYAVENAVDELKQIATGSIESNDDDGVAKWLEKTHNNLLTFENIVS